MPEHSGKPLDPFAFRLPDAFAQAVEDGMTADLSLTIALGAVQRREPMSDFVLDTEGSHLFAGEVRSVVGYDGVREAEATYEVLSHEL